MVHQQQYQEQLAWITSFVYIRNTQFVKHEWQQRKARPPFNKTKTTTRRLFRLDTLICIMARTSSRTPHNHLQEKAVYLIRCPDNTARSLQLIMLKCVSTYT